MHNQYFKYFAASLLAVAAMFCSTAKVDATPINGFSLAISESVSGSTPLIMIGQDRPMITLTNLSTNSTISSFVMHMGDLTYSFGSLVFIPVPSPVNLTSYSPPTGLNVHAGLEAMTLNFSNFQPGYTYSVRADIDRNSDHGASMTNYRQALASGNDPSKWATVDVVFSDGTSLHELIKPSDISGAPQNPVYSYFYCLTSWPGQGLISLQQSTPVPEPGTLLLAMLGMVTVSFTALRRRVSGRTPSGGV